MTEFEVLVVALVGAAAWFSYRRGFTDGEDFSRREHVSDVLNICLSSLEQAGVIERYYDENGKEVIKPGTKEIREDG